MTDKSERQPHRVRLPGFITDEEIGLGDVIKHATSTVVLDPATIVPSARRGSTAGWFSSDDVQANDS